ncbi:helix-turn-helix transcriptional regulator [Phytoactinopolyspora limicola]|uniref:helix-turn-helix transcriptional regulator n=1 Tax=Phytoactinopolyspora limicola TaxID=2715536 RepID=UPI00140BA71B|nr:AraC family transcriptional regulator [Phytoactinopolyspora limicola]
MDENAALGRTTVGESERGPSTLSERARFIRPSSLPGVEALHATFVAHRYAPHLHDGWTVAYVDRGAAGFDVNREFHTAAAGHVFFIPPWTVHTGQPATPDGYTYRVLYVDVESADRFGSRLATKTAVRELPTVLQHTGLAAALHTLHTTLQDQHSALEQGESLAAVDTMLAPLLAAHPTTRRTHPAVEQARDYIRANWRDDFTLHELAEACHLSPSHLTTLFHRQVGAPPSAYRRSVRVLHAKRLLRRGESIADVASHCGFYDQPHFNRHFIRATGLTPRVYAARTR